MTEEDAKLNDLLVAISNKKYKHDAALINDNVCIIPRDGLYAISPWFSFLVQAEEEKKTTYNK